MTPVTLHDHLQHAEDFMLEMYERMGAGKWILIAPDGRIWSGGPRHTMQALIAAAGIDALMTTTGKENA